MKTNNLAELFDIGNAAPANQNSDYYSYFYLVNKPHEFIAMYAKSDKHMKDIAECTFDSFVDFLEIYNMNTFKDMEEAHLVVVQVINGNKDTLIMKLMNHQVVQ